MKIRKIKIKDKYMKANGSYIPTCPDCKRQVRRLIEHHLITKKLMKYLEEVHNWDGLKLLELRRDLKIILCQKCEKKFHNGEFYKY